MNDELFQMPTSTGPTDGHTAPSEHEMYCRVHGKVQGVMFRSFVVKLADRMRLKGYVKNMPDGTVEVVAQGGEHDLRRFVEHMRHGSSTAHVTEVDDDMRKPTESYASFEVVG